MNENIQNGIQLNKDTMKLEIINDGVMIKEVSISEADKLPEIISETIIQIQSLNRLYEK